MDVWVIFHFLAVVSTVRMLCPSFGGCVFSILAGIYLGVELLSHTMQDILKEDRIFAKREDSIAIRFWLVGYHLFFFKLLFLKVIELKMVISVVKQDT